MGVYLTDSRIREELTLLHKSFEGCLKKRVIAKVKTCIGTLTFIPSNNKNSVTVEIER